MGTGGVNNQTNYKPAPGTIGFRGPNHNPKPKSK